LTGQEPEQDIGTEIIQAIAEARDGCQQFVIIGTGPYYVQVLPNRDYLYGEAVSNAYLTGRDRLSNGQVRRMVGLGWNRPGEQCHSECRRKHPNFHRIWPQAVPGDVIVRELLTALVVVYMRGEGDQVTVTRRLRGHIASTGLPTAH
jgi:hypothetical protein